MTAIGEDCHSVRYSRRLRQSFRSSGVRFVDQCKLPKRAPIPCEQGNLHPRTEPLLPQRGFELPADRVKADVLVRHNNLKRGKHSIGSIDAFLCDELCPYLEANLDILCARPHCDELKLAFETQIYAHVLQVVDCDQAIVGTPAWWHPPPPSETNGTVLQTPVNQPILKLLRLKLPFARIVLKPELVSSLLRIEWRRDPDTLLRSLTDRRSGRLGGDSRRQQRLVSRRAGYESETGYKQ